METFLGIDYPTWWFLVVGALFSGYVILDGFDLGAGAWHLFFKKEKSRRIALNAVGPVWDGNEVWLVIGGGALFAGFPVLYASLFSAMYIPLMLFLGFLIFRAISIEFRSKEKMAWWRRTWDIAYSVSSIGLALLLGVLLGNVLIGMPLDDNLNYQGSWLAFLNPYALLVGLTVLAMFMVHGGLYLSMKTEGKLFDKVVVLIRRGILIFVALFAISSFLSLRNYPHLSDRFMNDPILLIVPIAGFLAIANIPRLVSKSKFRWAFIFSAITMSLFFMTIAIELYPVLIHSTGAVENSITIYNAASSTKALKIMLIICAIGGPLVAFYTAFVYMTFRGKVVLDEMSY